MSAIVVKDISKRFKIPHHKKTTLFQNMVGLVKRQMTYEEFWALKDVSFEVQRGETFGIIGRNGSGKSTLLKILAGVFYPDSGSIVMNGKVASFLELGVGFQPELTAKENVYIYSSIMGMNRKETAKIYEGIFEFAELKRFEDMKLKNFSSGMYLRLAFATAIQTEPDIMLVDEVLAVGDEAFQKKCMQKINEFKVRGKTIILVSHALDMVRQLCDAALLIDEGQIITLGDVNDAITKYLSLCEVKSGQPDGADLNANRNFTTVTQQAKSAHKRHSLILGADNDPDFDYYTEPNYFVLSQYAANKSGVIREILIKCFAAGHVKIAVYANDNGEPGALLNAVNSDTSVFPGWNSIPFPATPIRTNDFYWLAYCSDNKLAGTKLSSNSQRRFRPVDYATFALPDTAGNNFTQDLENYDIIAAWGKTTR